MAEFLTGLEERGGDLTLLSPLDAIYPFYSLNTEKVSGGDVQ